MDKKKKKGSTDNQPVVSAVDETFNSYQSSGNRGASPAETDQGTVKRRDKRATWLQSNPKYGAIRR